MKRFLHILLLQSPLFCLAQDWGANHAVWYYSQIVFEPPFNSSYTKYSAIGDTIVQGDNAQIFKEENISNHGSPSSEIIKKSDTGRVYLFVPERNEFRMIYDFNAMPGDTVEIFCRYAWEDSTILILIDSVSTVYMDGQALKVQHVSQLYEQGDEFQMNGKIIENIGWTGFMFPLHAWADPPTGGPIRCFQNDSISIKFSDIPCDYLYEENLNFLVEGKTWTFLIGGDHPYPEIYTDYRYKIGNDTIINGIKYKKLLFAMHSDNYKIVTGFIREEENGKVYYRENSLNNEAEFLLYDFGMEVGDTARLGRNNSFYKLDSVRTNTDGRKVYYFGESQFGDSIWIEGIGSTMGLLKEQITGGSMNFSCCLLGDDQLYHNPAFTSCYYDGVNISEFDGKFGERINIFPNPARGEITISIPFNAEVKMVELLDLSGRVIQQWSDLKPGNNAIGLKSVIPGIYLIKAETDSGIISKKLIVQ